MLNLQFTSTLRFRLTAAFVMLVAVTASLMGVMVNQNSKRNLLRLHERTGFILARSIARTAEQQVMTRNTERLRELLEYLQRESFARYATVFAPDGEILGIWYADLVDIPPSGKVLGPVRNSPTRELEQNGEPITEFEVPILGRAPAPAAGASDGAEGSPTVVGTVRLGLSRQPVLDHIAQAHDQILRLVLTSIVLGVVASFFIVRSFLRPVTRLIDATRLIGKGEFDTVVGRVPIPGELGALASSLTAMARDLRNMKRQLVEANVHLERKVSERTIELERALEELKVLDRMKDEFLSSVSHEFRTPLTSIRAYAEILLKFQDEEPETQIEFLEIIILESERLTRLVNDILDMVKIESGDMEWTMNRVNVLELAEESLRSLRPILDEHHLKGTITRRGEVPAVRGDYDRLSQVMSNLLSNAIKFSHEGGSVEVTAEAREDSVEIVVVDHGIGIEPQDQQKIFDRFKQVGDTLTDKPRGTGLGLPICKNIVERHGGSIWVESTPGHGSRFHFALPVEGPTEEDLRRPTQPDAQGIVVGSSATTTVICPPSKAPVA